MHSLRLPAANPTRKQRFNAALELAGMTIEQWRVDVHRVSRGHLHRVLSGEENGGAELDAAIDATIAKYLPSPAE
jgi:hypothetical protein